MQNNDKHYKGTYNIIDMGNPDVVHSIHDVTSKEEFDTLLNKVIKYNHESPQKKRQLVKL